MIQELILNIQKGENTISINCNDHSHYNKLVKRYNKKGYKVISPIIEEKKEQYPF